MIQDIRIGLRNSEAWNPILQHPLVNDQPVEIAATIHWEYFTWRKNSYEVMTYITKHIELILL
jgi:hypothetical protein